MQWEMDRRKNERLVAAISENSGRSSTAGRMRPGSRRTLASAGSGDLQRSTMMSKEGSPEPGMELTEYEKLILAKSGN